MFDFTVALPHAEAVRGQAAVRRGHAAEHAEQGKITMYEEACVEQGFLFIPLAVETYGGWGAMAQETFKSLSHMISHRSGNLKSESDELRWMYQRHSVALQRDNARMILRRAPAYDPPG